MDPTQAPLLLLPTLALSKQPALWPLQKPTHAEDRGRGQVGFQPPGGRNPPEELAGTQPQRRLLSGMGAQPRQITRRAGKLDFYLTFPEF